MRVCRNDQHSPFSFRVLMQMRSNYYILAFLPFKSKKKSINNRLFSLIVFCFFFFFFSPLAPSPDPLPMLVGVLRLRERASEFKGVLNDEEKRNRKIMRGRNETGEAHWVNDEKSIFTYDQK